MSELLIVCRENTGRSQVAEAFFNTLISPGIAESAGTQVPYPDLLVGERAEAEETIKAMLELEEAIDISRNRRRQVTPDMVRNFARVIIMAEPDTVPGWLLEHPHTTEWEIRDLKGRSPAETREIISEIRERVLGLEASSAQL